MRKSNVRVSKPKTPRGRRSRLRRGHSTRQNIVVSMNDENPQSTAAATPGTAAAPLPLNKNKATRRRM